MDERPKWTPEQLEMLEMLRSKGDAAVDPALASTAKALEEAPELAQRLERILEWDIRVSEAMSDVSVPPALAEQIIQSLEAPSARPLPGLAPPLASGRARRLAWSTVATCVGLAVILIAVVMLRSVPTLDEERIRSIAGERFVQNQADLPAGTSVTPNNFPARFPYSPDLVNVPGTRWRHIPDFDGAGAFAYDVPLGANKATVYVVRCRSNALLPQRPPTFPRTSTQGIVIGVWRGDGVVYVAVVAGGEAAYRALLRSTFHPLT
jgi:hypothetical protein